MPIDFPSSPTNGQVSGNYYYDATTGAWRSFSSTVNPIPSTLKNLTVSSSAANGVSLKVTPFTTSSVNLQEWYNTSSTVVASMNVAGDLAVNSVTLSNNLSPSYGGVPTGAINQFAGASAPSGWLMCQGQELPISSYTALYSVLTSSGTTFPYGTNTNGSGATGTTHFRLPDFQGRVPVAPSGSTGRITSNNTLGAASGAESVTLTSSQIPAHSHPNTLTDPGHNHTQNSHNHTQDPHSHGGVIIIGGISVPQGSYYGSYGQYGTTNTSNATATNQATTATNNANYTGMSITNANNTGGGGSHNNLQPYIVVNYIIKT